MDEPRSLFAPITQEGFLALRPGQQMIGSNGRRVRVAGRCRHASAYWVQVEVEGGPNMGKGIPEWEKGQELFAWDESVRGIVNLFTCHGKMPVDYLNDAEARIVFMAA